MPHCARAAGSYPIIIAGFEAGRLTSAEWFGFPSTSSLRGLAHERTLLIPPEEPQEAFSARIVMEDTEPDVALDALVRCRR